MQPESSLRDRLENPPAEPRATLDSARNAGWVIAHYNVRAQGQPTRRVWRVSRPWSFGRVDPQTFETVTECLRFVDATDGAA